MGKGEGDEGYALLAIPLPFMLVDCILLNGLNLYPFDRESAVDGVSPFPCTPWWKPNKNPLVNAGLCLLGLPFTPFAFLCEVTGCGKCVSDRIQKYQNKNVYDEKFQAVCCLLCCTGCFADKGDLRIASQCAMDPKWDSKRRTGPHMYFGGAIASNFFYTCCTNKSKPAGTLNVQAGLAAGTRSSTSNPVASPTPIDMKREMEASAVK